MIYNYTPAPYIPEVFCDATTGKRGEKFEADGAGSATGITEPWNVERKKYFIFEMTTKKILLCERWNDKKNTVNRSAFQKKILLYYTTLNK